MTNATTILITAYIIILSFPALAVAHETMLLHSLFNGAIMAWWLGHCIANPWVPVPKLLGGSKVKSVFHSFTVDQMSPRKSWGLSNKK